MKPILSAVAGTWVGHGSGNADWNFTDDRGRLAVPPDHPRFILRRVRIPEQLYKPYYDGLSNQALWPLCHNVYQRPSFRSSDWEAYRAVNHLFAEAVLDEVGDDDAVVFIQDYHLALLAGYLKERNPALKVGQFWHIPWPSCEIMETFPWLNEVLGSMLANDLIGFHLDRHCRNFFDIVESCCAAEVDRNESVIWTKGSAAKVRSVPISIDFDRHSRDCRSDLVNNYKTAWRQRLGDVSRLIVGIDRVDYTKGIPERLRAFGVLLDRCPELRGNVTLVQVGVPSRTAIPEFASLQARVIQLANEINARWGTSTWTPIVMESRNLTAPEMMALHQLAHVCVVSSLHDGMNLVAKEFVASRFDGDGVLVLSRFAGAARELSAAVQVNPFSEDSLVEGILTALRMPASERQWRMAGLRACLQKNNVYSWAAALLSQLLETETAAHESPAPFHQLLASLA
jgi:trehalose 6-phosphate synthase